MKKTASASRGIDRVGRLCLVLLLTAAGPSVAGTGFELSGDATAGQGHYQVHCASCHGTSARGDGPAARAFTPPPSDLTRDELNAEHLFLATRDGGMAVGLRATMPAFRHSLDDQAVHDVVAYIQSLKD